MSAKSGDGWLEMSIAYPKIQFQCALRSGQLEGYDSATLETAYTGTWASVLDGAEIPVSAFRDTILAVEKELAHIIASDKQQPYRGDLYGRSDALLNNAQIPTTDNASLEFIGVFSGVIDGTDLKPLTEMPVQTIEDLTSSFFDDTEFYHFAFIGERIRHTRATVFLEGCSWSYGTQLALYNAAGSSPLPQMLENTWIAGVLASLPQSANWFNAEGQMYAQIYQNGIQMLKMREMSAPILPDNTANAAPAKN